VQAEAVGSTAGFSEDPRVGPWATVLRSDPGFARAYVELDVARYQVVLSGIARTMFDRDTVPGPEPEDLLLSDVPVLVVPGQDSSHATSAARFLQECLPGAEYWDAPVAAQTAETAPARVAAFLDSVAGASRP
jgi:pimeloyl-ACP methyl ester carboxylesterase